LQESLSPLLSIYAIFLFLVANTENKMNSDSTFDMKLDKEIAALDCQSEDK
jgi:YbbR domain-containing protein